MDKSYQVNTYSRYDIEFVKGDGLYLFDKDGNQYLDFLSGIAVTGFGHNNSILVEAASNQINNLWHVSNLFKSTPQEELAKKLTFNAGLEKAFFCNSGTEANEAAIKFARKYGKGKSTIITINGGFHGRTMGSLSASAQEKLWEGFNPLTPGFKSVPYNNLETLKNIIDNETVAIMLESIQGENGIIVPDNNYLNEVRNICDINNLLLIVDEIQTGFGRTGKLFSYQYNNITPDIVTLAKGIANGFPLGAVLCSKKVSEVITPGSHGSTFGGNPTSIAVANKVMDLLTEDILSQVKSLGRYFKDKFSNKNFKNVKSINGKGLMIGIQFDQQIDVKKLAGEFLKNKIVVGTAGNNVLRLLPPLIIEEKHIDQIIHIFEKVLNNEFVELNKS